MSKRTYSQIKEELQQILDWFEGSDVDIDKAVEKHKQASKLIEELEAYLESAKKKES